MDIQNITIFVDGPTEKGSLETYFHKHNGKSPKFAYGPGNGIKYSAESYAKNVTGHIIYALSSSSYAIILIPDLEKRHTKLNITCSMFGTQIKDAIISEIISKTKFSKEYLKSVIYVCPSDIMFENWIVCDIKGISKSTLLNKNCKQSNFDGQNGAHLLTKLMQPNKYKKTVHARQLFKMVNPDIGIINSASYKCFMSAVQSLIKTK
ncbi:MAG: hypothetical protein K2I85_00675 [Alistipes sp.]|nr:hypothetical protein [Alistipes sp.]